jgi:acetyl esterase/lipase
VIRHLGIALCSTLLCVCLAVAAESTQPHEPGSVLVPSYTLPESSLLDEESRAALRRASEDLAEEKVLFDKCPLLESAPRSEMPAIRRCLAEAFYQTPRYKKLRARYDVTVAEQQMAGVTTEIFTPAGGVASGNANRVLVNLHGGAFLWGARTTSHLESIPIAAVGKIKVISVDYRQAPEYSFPAATEDVTAVYRELLETYAPQNIGIYGCSAGALLTAEVVASLQKSGLPRPGAVGMLCGGAAYWAEGDMGRFGAAVQGSAARSDARRDSPYFRNVDPTDPLAFPVRSREVLARFPPTLVISSTRDLALSSAVHTHSLLVREHVAAALHVWEGLGHGFFTLIDLPQSREVYDVVVAFFDRHLGRAAPGASAAAPDLSLEQALAAEVDRFVAADKIAPPRSCQILFVGSSSIAKWSTLANDMAPLPVINRGFGGSHIEYVNRWFDQIVAPYRPRAIVFYAGENDLAAGKTAQRVVGDFDAFMARKTEVLGRTPVYFIAVKPSKLRFAQFALQTEVNNRIRSRADRRSDLVYVDVVTQMLEQGSAKDVFEPDGLHMTSDGYEIWTRAVRAALLPDRGSSRDTKRSDAQARCGR